jgi:hypothetical protein
MQISFSKDTVYTPEWRGNDKLAEGEQFTATLTLLNVEDLLFLLDAFNEAGIQGEVEQTDLDTDQLKPILKSNGHLLPKYVKINNLKNSETGVDLTTAEIVEFPFFLNLAAELLMKLAEVSSPNDDDVGNSNALPDGDQTQELPAE